MPAWSRKYERCVNCGTQERSHRGNGFCTKCYGPATRLRQVEAWDLDTPPDKRAGIPWSYQRLPRPQLAQLKSGLAAELQRRLDTLEHWESARGRKPSALTVEYRLRRVAQFAGVSDRNMFFGSAGYLDSTFDAETLTALNDLLLRIEEDRPWQVNWLKALSGPEA